MAWVQCEKNDWVNTDRIDCISIKKHPIDGAVKWAVVLCREYIHYRAEKLYDTEEEAARSIENLLRQL